jgi:predicted nucleic acid-binding protein
MGSSTDLTDPSAMLAADASTIINLVATGYVRDIVSALPNRLIVVDVVRAELENGRPRGRAACDRLEELVKGGVIDLVALGDEAATHFEGLVVGPTISTLDDGEAATIAWALSRQGTALIDERKARRICVDRFPELRVACTVDVLIHPVVQRELGSETLGEAVFNALNCGRMRVLPKHMPWVIATIGVRRVSQCQSLPRNVRLAAEQPPQGTAQTLCDGELTAKRSVE